MLWLLAYPRRQTKKVIDLSEDYSFKMSFDRKRLIHTKHISNSFHRSIKSAAFFTTFYLWEIGFSAMNKIKSKFRSKLQLSNNLRLKLTHIIVDVKESSVKTENKPIVRIHSIMHLTNKHTL
ncbi:hypothetical protein T03_8231, partial [Trichinella britovi]